MCGWEIEFPSSIHSVDIMSSDSSQLCVLTHDGFIHFFRLTDSEEDSKECHPQVAIHCREGGSFRPVWSRSMSLDALKRLEFYHWRFVNQGTLVACSTDELHVFKCEENIVTLK